MNKILIPALVTSLVLTCPINASELIPSIDRCGDKIEFVKNDVYRQGNFSPNNAREFLLKLRGEINEKYGINLNFNDAINKAVDILAQNGNFTPDQIETIRAFYVLITEPQMQEANGWKFWQKKKDKHKSKSSQKVGMTKMQKDFLLPDEMALGFMLILGGSLLCVVPLGITQNIGAGLIVGGITTIATSAAKGEKPYFADSETRQPNSPNAQDSPPAIGVGTGF